jgi:hypothetical protein
MFPGATATVYTNEEGEVIGWDYDPGPDPSDVEARWYEMHDGWVDEPEDD